jgi:hypothetical protein
MFDSEQLGRHVRFYARIASSQRFSPKRCLGSLFRFILPVIEQIRSDHVTPTRLRDVPALDAFLMICHFSSGDRSTRGFLPIMPPVWMP